MLFALSLILSIAAATVTAGVKNPALGKSISTDFSSNSSYFEDYHTPDKIKYGSDNGLELTLAKRFDNPSIKSKFYLMFGRVEATVQSAPGTGVATTVYLQSDDLDEIDIEWLGGDNTQVQSNFFSKGDTTTYDRGAFHTVSSPTTTFHTYTIDWTNEHVEWYIDGALVRTLKSDSPEGFPQSPMALYLGVWAAGDSSNAPGTIEWAGGLTDYSQAPFSAYIKKLVVTDYSTGSSYTYGDSSGSWESIKAENGKVLGNVDGADATESATSSSSSATSSATSSSSSATSSSSSATSSSSSATSTSDSTTTLSKTTTSASASTASSTETVSSTSSSLSTTSVSETTSTAASTETSESENSTDSEVFTESHTSFKATSTLKTEFLSTTAADSTASDSTASDSTSVSIQSVSGASSVGKSSLVKSLVIASMGSLVFILLL